ncbi:hypothetical protein [Dyadobacter crusticola]|uniref:hypothetical protein n=1 Tax=Dyadobacter crusticola TaxID=292407 RepID=UPI0004E13EC6|nr:hypothetical protein [Dyadobacter crusticola]
MKKLASITSLLLVLFIGCKSDDKITPTETWSEGCISMVPDGDNYRITGGCCYEIAFRAMEFPAGKKRSITAVYFTSTGAKMINYPINLIIEKSPDGSRLKVSHPAHSKEYNFIPVKAALACFCACD